MADEFATNSDSLIAPAQDAAAVTPSATALANVTKGIYVGTAGDLAVTMLGGDDVTFASVPAGSILPIRVTHVLEASTADDIVAFW
jgi:hypothetical protein